MIRSPFRDSWIWNGPKKKGRARSSAEVQQGGVNGRDIITLTTSNLEAGLLTFKAVVINFQAYLL